MSHDSTFKTIMVALGVCLVCSILVSTTAVTLNEKQEQNKKRDEIKNILAAGDLLQDNREDFLQIFQERIQPQIIELASGTPLPESEYDKNFTPENFNIKEIAKSSQYSTPLEADQDIAQIKRKPKYMIVYFVKKEGTVEKIIVPVYGRGLWSTLYGFLALDKNLKTVRALTFYEHGETPGLGGEVDNKSWKAQWDGKKAFNDTGELVLQVLKGKVDPSKPGAESQVDGLTGATITTRGVDQLIKFWLGENGYGPFLAVLEKEGANEQE
ncbi:Na(+)-translocating NADH-quinone reductase subunit C [candidate division KSB1 bacterium]|nr:Na(+)-translocating NADH-quinone reductase subunit C [candidate division KSB1 bacterium]